MTHRRPKPHVGTGNRGRASESAPRGCPDCIEQDEILFDDPFVVDSKPRVKNIIDNPSMQQTEVMPIIPLHSLGTSKSPLEESKAKTAEARQIVMESLKQTFIAFYGFLGILIIVFGAVYGGYSIAKLLIQAL